MSDFKEMYSQKLVSAEKAAAVVKSGDWVDYGWCATTPVAVDKALAKRMPDLYDVKFRGGILMWVPEIFKVENPAEHLTWNSWHMGGIERKAVAQGFSFYAPIRYSELPRYYRDSQEPLDVAIMQVAPMDQHGWFNFGPSASHLAAACEKAKVVIVEVNENVPRCLGGFENGIHISQVDMVVEGFSYESVFRFLRCGLTDITEEEMDRLENYVIAMGIRGLARWEQEWVRSYRGEDPEECVKLNPVRQKLVDMWRPFAESLKDPQGTVKTCCQALYKFICENHIEKK